MQLKNQEEENHQDVEPQPLELRGFIRRLRRLAQLHAASRGRAGFGMWLRSFRNTASGHLRLSLILPLAFCRPALISTNFRQYAAACRAGRGFSQHRVHGAEHVAPAYEDVDARRQPEALALPAQSGWKADA